jgi:hypothetical protein
LVEIGWQRVLSVYHLVKVIPEILNDAHVRGIRVLWWYINVLKLKPACHMLGCVHSVIVMLEIHVITVHIMVIKGSQEVFEEDINVQEPVHDAMDTMKVANTIAVIHPHIITLLPLCFNFFFVYLILFVSSPLVTV